MLAAKEGAPAAHEALQQLFGAYWFPLFAHLRARGRPHHEVEDLVQAFFVHLCEKQTLARADRFKGSFRGYLLGCLRYFLANEREFRAAHKRGGGVRMLSIDIDDAEQHLQIAGTDDVAGNFELDFDRRWAQMVMRRSLSRLQKNHADRPELFARLTGFLTASDDTRYDQVAAELAVSLSVVKTTVHRLRREFRDLLRQEIATTVSAPHEIDDELRHLVQVLSAE